MTTSLLTPQNFNISARTDREIAEIRIKIASEKNYSLRYAHYGVELARTRGILSGAVELKIRNLNGYQYAKLVCEIGNAGISQNDTGKYLADRFI